MNQTIAGFLLFKKPNQYTQQSQVSPGIHVLALPCMPEGMSTQESFLVGTRCGTVQFHQSRVDEFVAFKRGIKSMRDIVFQYDTMLTLHEYNMNWRYYYNRQMKRWFGDDLIDIF